MLVWNACLLIAAAQFVTEVPEPFRTRLASTNEASGAFVQTKTTDRKSLYEEYFALFRVFA